VALAVLPCGVVAHSMSVVPLTILKNDPHTCPQAGVSHTGGGLPGKLKRRHALAHVADTESLGCYMQSFRRQHCVRSAPGIC
jgi:hypothetical protein